MTYLESCQEKLLLKKRYKMAWELGQMTKMLCINNFIVTWNGFIYCMRAIITRGLYTFYPLFEVQKRFFNGLFS